MTGKMRETWQWRKCHLDAQIPCRTGVETSLIVDLLAALRWQRLLANLSAAQLSLHRAGSAQ
jgi:hypothetical protein